MTTRLTKQDIEQYGKPPEGKRYLKKDGKVLINHEGKPITTFAKTKRTPNRPRYVIPVGKLKSAITEGFNVIKHKKLSLRDFADPLHYWQWNLWYTREKFKADEKLIVAKIELMIELGRTKS